MRPYNTYRNPELSQPVSSVENTLADKTSNSNPSFDILRSLSESISVDCGSFEISAPSECTFAQQYPASSQLRDENCESRETNQSPQPVFQNPAVNTAGASDADDDNYDCMNDPNYRAQCVKETNSPSFEELMARTAEGIAKMREETDRVGSQLEADSANTSSFGNKTLSSCPRGFAPRAAYSNSEKDETRGQRRVAENSNTSRTQTKTEPVKNAPKPEKSVKSQSESSGKKSFLSSINWDKTRKLLFSREAIKLTLLSIAVSGLIVSAVIYKNSSRYNNGLPESDDVVMNQSASEIQDVPVQENSVNSNNGEFSDSSNGNYWGNQDNNTWASSDNANPRGLTDQMRGDYQSPTFDAAPSGIEYSQNETDGYLSPEDAGRPLASPHNSNYGNQYEVARANGEAPFPNRATARLTESAPVGRFDSRNSQSGTNLVGIVDAMPVNNVGPQYAEAAPAIGSQYNPNEYESPVLEDDSVSEYSETGFNSNFMR